MLLSTLFAPVLGIASYLVFAYEFSILLGTAFSDAPPSGDSPTFSYLPAQILGLGYTLFSLIACTIGFFHARATYRGKWMAFGWGPLLLLEIVGLFTWGLFFSYADFFKNDGMVPLLLVVIFAPLLVLVVCLVYALLY
jgi:hypothetical protein